jgi:antitoxin component YwqK of YwqJK toxin-antitoxin module
MSSEGSYKNGRLDGKWTSWDENGQVTKEAIYEDGELKEQKNY